METGKILVGTSNETSFYLSKYISKKFHMISTQDSASAIASNESQKFGNRCFFSWDTLLFYSFPSETLKKSLQKSKYTSMKGCDHVVYQSSGQLFLWRGSIFFFLFLMWKINQYELKLEFFNYRNRWSESVPIIHTYTDCWQSEWENATKNDVFAAIGTLKNTLVFHDGFTCNEQEANLN